MTITLVQQKSGAGTSLSFTSPTTAGNCVIVGYTDADSVQQPGITSVTLGGSAGHFADLAAAGGNPSGNGFFLADLWADPNCAGGQTAVSVTPFFTIEPTIWIAEFSGIVSSSPLDKSSSATGTTASWSSGSTATTAQAAELWVGAFANVAATAVGPGSPWTNFSVSDGSGPIDLYGYQIRSTTGTAAYAGTGGDTTNGWGAVVVTLKGAAAGVSGTVQPPATVPVPRRRRARGQWQRITGAAFVKVAAPAQQPRPAPRRRLARAFIRFTPVTTVNAPPPPPVPGTVQPPATVPVPRRKPARGVSHGITVPGAYGTAPAQEFRVAPRRKLARAVWRRITGQAFVQVAAPRQEFRVPPRRTRGRAVVRFTPVTTVNAPPHRTLLISLASQAGTDDYANSYPQGIMATAGVIEGPSIIGSTITGGTFDGNDFIINDSGEFFYSGTPGFGNLIASVTSTSGFDQFGNSFQEGLTAYDGFGNWIQVSSGSINFSNGTSIANYSGLGTPAAVLQGSLRINGVFDLNGTQLTIPQGQPAAPNAAPSSYNQLWGQNITGVLNAIITAGANAGIW